MSDTFDDWLRNDGREHYGTYTNMARQAWIHQQEKIAQLQATIDRLQEPDEAMIRAGNLQLFQYFANGNAREDQVKRIFKAMLSAAKGELLDG